MASRKPRTDGLDAMLGARVKGLRKARGLTQSALAQRLQITFQQVQKYENGTNRISAIVLMKLADALGVPAMELMEDVGPQEAPDSLQADVEKLLADFHRVRSPEMRAAILKIVAGLAE